MAKENNISVDDIIICIPVYKKELSPSENLSLQQVRRILCRYKICFVTSNDLDVEAVGYIQDELVVKFPNRYFKSVVSYSKLMLSCFFYEVFSAYQYMLIYQLDAFVFRDDLLNFCNMGYDYIGAVWPAWHLKVPYRVGNGGFSLRNIQSCINVLKQKEAIYHKTGLQAIFEGWEDVFFAFCGGQNDIDFQVPNRNVATTFAVETDINKYINKDVLFISRTLPFGCHKWSKWPYYSFWRNIIVNLLGDKWDSKIDDELKEIDSVAYTDIYMQQRNRFIYEFFKNRFFKYGYDKDEIYTKILLGKKDIIIWGYGLVGRKAVDVLKKMGISIKYICDKNVKKDMYFRGIKIVSPDANILGRKKYFVMITTSKYRKEIVMKLQEMNYNEDEYAYIDDFENMVFNMYIRRFFEKLKS